MRAHLAAAHQVARLIPTVLVNRGIEPTIKRYVLAETAQGCAWFFAELDHLQIPRIERYVHRETIHQISTAIGGRPVVISNTAGLRYAILLGGRPALPSQVDFPGWRQGLLQIGVNRTNSAVCTTWARAGHIMVAGMTGKGKSNFLRLLVRQAIGEDFQLALADRDGRTFPQLAGHPSLIAPLGTDDESCRALVAAVQAEIDRRKSTFEAAPNFPADLDTYNAQAPADPLPRLLVVIDEYNALITHLGGPRGAFGAAMADIAWRGRKFGLTLVLAAQDFTKAIIGPVRDQMTTRICFAVQKPTTSRVVLDRPGAERLHAPGRALTARWGLVQTYHATLDDLRLGDGRTAGERKLSGLLLEQHAGKMTLAVLCDLGISQRAARRLQADWERRGLATRGPNNAFFVRPPHDRTNAQTHKPE